MSFPHVCVLQIWYSQGCWFGAKDKGIFLCRGIDAARLAAADMHDLGRLCQVLAQLLFTKEELARGCATEPRKRGIQQLDVKKMNANRGVYNILNLDVHFLIAEVRTLHYLYTF